MGSAGIEIHGTCSSGYEPVRDAFRENFAHKEEIGASVAALVAGLAPDAPVARYWPEFRAGGKGDIPVRWVTSHRAGLASFAVPVSVADLGDWEKMTSLLAAQEPLWEPGTVSGYHAITFGFLAGEIARRITGQPGHRPGVTGRRLAAARKHRNCACGTRRPGPVLLDGLYRSPGRGPVSAFTS